MARCYRVFKRCNGLVCAGSQTKPLFISIPTFDSWQTPVRPKASFDEKRWKMAEKPLTEKRSITPEMAVKILQKNGVQIDERKAAELLDLMYFFAKLSVNQYIKEVSSNR
jgi:hypothetical protein